MLSHVELYVSDLERSMAFWTPFMALLGYEAERWSQGVNYVSGERDPYVCLVQAPAEHLGAGYHRRRVGLNHLAFRAPSRAQVRKAFVQLRDKLARRNTIDALHRCALGENLPRFGMLPFAAQGQSGTGHNLQIKGELRLGVRSRWFAPGNPG